ncbi:MAG: hypothetical protein ACYC3K_12250 [Candidatus Nanopelagicales bacterium]
MVTAVTLSSCSALSLSTSADSLERGEYTRSQALVYRQVALDLLEEARAEAPVPVETSTETGSDEDWAPYEVRAKALCDDARTRGWEAAREAYTEQVMAFFQAHTRSGPLTDSDIEDFIAPAVENEVRAVTAPGSFCPDVE